MKTATNCHFVSLNWQKINLVVAKFGEDADQWEFLHIAGKTVSRLITWK